MNNWFECKVSFDRMGEDGLIKKVLMTMDNLPEDIIRHIWVLPIGIHFMQDKERMFNDKITGYVQKNLRDSRMA